MFVRVNAIFNTWGVILHEGRIGGFKLTFYRLPRKVYVQNMAAVKVFFLVVVFYCGTQAFDECHDDYDCPGSKVCCKKRWSWEDNECAYSCVGKSCDSNSDCGGDYCCNNICRSSCSGYSCILDSDCGDNGYCCDYSCQTGTCFSGLHAMHGWIIAVIVLSILGFVGTIAGVLLCVYCSYRRSRSPGLIVNGAPLATVPATTMVAGSNCSYAQDQGPPPVYQPPQPQTMK